MSTAAMVLVLALFYIFLANVVLFGLDRDYPHPTNRTFAYLIVGAVFFWAFVAAEIHLLRWLQ